MVAEARVSRPPDVRLTANQFSRIPNGAEGSRYLLSNGLLDDNLDAR